jgi:hypothetical protein
MVFEHVHVHAVGIPSVSWSPCHWGSIEMSMQPFDWGLIRCALSYTQNCKRSCCCCCCRHCFCFSGAASGCPGSAHHGSSLLGSTISEPHPATASGLGMFGLQPGSSSAAAHYHPLLSPAGSSLPHAIVEEQARPLAASGSNGSTAMEGVEQGGSGVNAARPSSNRSTRRSSSCPGEGVYGDQRPARSGSSSHQHGRASYSSGGALQNAMSVPVGSSSGGSVGGRSSRDGSEREEGEGSGRSKVGRWLRRVLHLEGPWRGAMPAGVFMGVV